jgi:DNA-binding beta-propeller fold protein YncE
MNFPGAVAVDSQGFVYVPDSDNHRVQILQADGTFVVAWGQNGTGEGEFDHPSSIALDATGSIYVDDKDNNRIQKFLGLVTAARHVSWGALKGGFR